MDEGTVGPWLDWIVLHEVPAALWPSWIHEDPEAMVGLKASHYTFDSYGRIRSLTRQFAEFEDSPACR